MSATGRTVDYVILGAGIGGMTLQHILKGTSTVLIDPAPGRYKIGESIIPQHFIEPEVRPLFDIVSRLPSSTPKEGSLFVSHDSVGAFPPFSESNFTIHVARQELEAATAKFFGTEVVREHVEAVDVAARTVETDQGTFVARKLIIDCSGPSRIVARALGLAREVWPVWASWAYHDVVDRDDERFWSTLRRGDKQFFLYDEAKRRLEESTHFEALKPTHSTILTHVADGTWTWQIPLHGARLLSVGVVSRRGPVSADEYVDVTTRSIGPQFRTQLRPWDRSGPFNNLHVRNRFAWAADRFAGDSWALVGDAAFFGDPVYSVGTGFATNHAIQLGRMLLAREWDARTAAAHDRQTAHLYERARRAYDWWYFGKVVSDKRVADEVQADFLNGRAFQVQTASAWSDMWLVSHPQDTANRPSVKDGQDVTAPIERLLDEAALAGWRLTAARAFATKVELEWQRPDCAPMLLTIERAASVRHYYRRIDELALSYRASEAYGKKLDGQALALLEGFAQLLASEAALLRLLLDATA